MSHLNASQMFIIIRGHTVFKITTNKNLTLNKYDADDEAELGSLVPHGTGTLLGQSHLNVNRLNFKPVGHSPLLTLR